MLRRRVDNARFAHAPILSIDRSVHGARAACGCGKPRAWIGNRLDRERLAQAVRAACIAAAVEAHEQAGISGLCQEGPWDVATEAVRSRDLAIVIAATS